MSRISTIVCSMAATLYATPLAAQDAAAESTRPFLLEIVLFFVSIPYTLYLVFVEGDRLHLLPAPLMGLWVFFWSFREWRRQRYWVPRLVPIMSVLGLATIIAINVDWVMNGGEMWTQRYVVIAIFGLFPWIAYVVLGGPRLIGRRRSGVSTDDGETSARATAGGSDESTHDMTHEVDDDELPLPWRPARVRMEGPLWVRALAVGLVGIVALVVFTGPKVQASELRPDLAVLRDPGLVVEGAEGTVLGNPGAPITIFVFGDYQCAACAAFSNRFRPMLESTFVDTGEARIVFFDRPFRNRHPHAELAARATYCADEQEGFWPLHTRLFAEQEAWTDQADPRPLIEQYASEEGLDAEALAECVESGRHADRVAANERLADELGVRSTPTIVVGRRGGDPRRSPAYTYDAIERTIREVTARGSS